MSKELIGNFGNYDKSLSIRETPSEETPDIEEDD